MADACPICASIDLESNGLCNDCGAKPRQAMNGALFDTWRKEVDRLSNEHTGLPAREISFEEDLKHSFNGRMSPREFVLAKIEKIGLIDIKENRGRLMSQGLQAQPDTWEWPA